MILITRPLARLLRMVFRHAALGLDPRRSAPPLVFSVVAGRLSVCFRGDGLAVAYDGPGAAGPRSAAAVALPLEALIEVEGGDPSPVLLESVAVGRTLVRRVVGGVAQARTFAYLAPGRSPPLPAPLPGWTPASPAIRGDRPDRCPRGAPGRPLDALPRGPRRGAIPRARPAPAGPG